MATAFIVSGLIVLSVLFNPAYGKANGALTASCTSMVPGHSGTNAQASAAPFSLTVDKTSYAEGDKIMVTLSKTSNTQFKGYLIQARDSNLNVIPGFSVPTAGKLLPCSSANGAVTHTESSAKNTVSFEFIAPETTKGNLTMYATVVKDFNTYWVKIPSAVIAAPVSGSSKGQFSMTILAFSFIFVYCCKVLRSQ